MPVADKKPDGIPSSAGGNGPSRAARQIRSGSEPSGGSTQARQGGSLSSGSSGSVPAGYGSGASASKGKGGGSNTAAAGAGGGSTTSVMRFKTTFRNTIYDTLLRRGWKETTENDWDFYWADREYIYDLLDTVHLENGQRVNHYRNGREVKIIFSRSFVFYTRSLISLFFSGSCVGKTCLSRT